MTTMDRLDRWKIAGIISDAQYSTLSRLLRREWFSLFFELNSLLYIGVLSLTAGLGWTVQTHFSSLGDLFVLTVLSTAFAASLYYCFATALPYSNAEIEAPTFTFDYVLYASCLILCVELGYIEFRFEWFRDAWSNYLLFCSCLFFVLAYRFDNRFVLSLALSSLAGWLGVRLSRHGMVSDTIRLSALLYGAVVGSAGVFLFKHGIKKHFLETFVHIAGNVIFAALLSGTFGRSSGLFLLGLLAASTGAIASGLRFRRFAFVAYGTIYGYIGVSAEIMAGMSEFGVLTYLVVTGTAVIIAIALLARGFAREE